MLWQLDLQRLATDHPFERRDLGLMLMHQISRLHVLVQLNLPTRIRIS